MSESDEEDAETKQQVLELKLKLLEWLEKEKIPNARTDDHTLLTFLYGCKLRLDRAQFKMKNYFEMRRTTPEWFKHRDPSLPDIVRLLNLGVFLPLPVRDEEGRSVILVRGAAHDPKISTMDDVFRTSSIVFDVALRSDMDFARNGLMIIIDLEGVSMGHTWQLTPGLIRKAVHMCQDCYPVRIRSIDIVNCPLYVDVVLKVFRGFMKDKLKKRLRVHGRGLASLHEVVSSRLLPEEYGGTCGGLGPVVKTWREAVGECRPWLLDDVT